ncbi:MAG TPA: hypothetical protein VGE29_03675 [Prosthecobacter sp.]
MTKLEARITWGNLNDGCLEAPFSGIKPSFFVAGELIAAIVECEVAAMERGHTYDVLIKLPYGARYLLHLNPGAKTRLQVGERVIATGEILRVRKDS